jgi:hypothetical protein
VTIEVPYPPTTPEQAVAWVEWAEAEIGVGWHPDTSAEALIEYATGRPTFTGERAKRYEEGLEAAHQLLPDIYATSMEALLKLHPELKP